ncbi:hypothetical protein BC628DRAFT_1149979 [Trametes gibbosa]|nr:hypothetical protein BC628DRAFT_1149979 [Trametes gibbosa]
MTATATIDTTLSDESTALKLIANLGFIETSVAALLVWQYLLTLDKEVALFWSRAPFGARVLFCSNRYLTLAWSLWAAAHWWAPWGASYTMLRSSSSHVFAQLFTILGLGSVLVPKVASSSV